MAKMLRDVEVENGGDAPRIHSMDDYFMTEVEKVLTCYFQFVFKDHLVDFPFKNAHHASFSVVMFFNVCY